MDDGVGSFDRVDLVAVTAPHPLSPVESYRFENTGRGASSAFNPPTCALRSELSPLYSHSSALFCTFLRPTKTQLFSFHTIPHSASKNRAAWDTPRNFATGIKLNQASAKLVPPMTPCVIFIDNRPAPGLRLARDWPLILAVSW